MENTSALRDRTEPESDDLGRGNQLQDRDRQLLALLALCRCLSTEQIRRLCFPGRTETPAEKRLRQLAGIGKYGFPNPFVERTLHQTYSGDLLPVWKPTPLGYAVAATVVETTTRPRRGAEIRSQFIEHALLLNELFVGLVEAPVKKALVTRVAAIPKRRHRSADDGLYANAKALTFNWIACDSVRLPWKEYRDAVAFERVIQPDAVLELPKPRRRLFLECETGSHTIVPRGFHKPGSTLSKVERYENFLCELADFDLKITFYEQQYPDQFAPEVLFLVPGTERADSINRAVREWSAQRPARCWKLPRAVTIFDAVREVLTMLGESVPGPGGAQARHPSRSTVVESAEIKLLCDFFEEAMGSVKEARDKARAKNQVPPAYPRTMESVRVLLGRLLRAANVAR